MLCQSGLLVLCASATTFGQEDKRKYIQPRDSEAIREPQEIIQADVGVFKWTSVTASIQHCRQTRNIGAMMENMERGV